MSTPLYRTANAVPGAVADPATLATEAVRCLWVRRIETRYLPTVIFKDGTDCPLACQMDEIAARQFCQRVSAVHDWPVMDHRPKDLGRHVTAEQSWARIPPEFKTEINGETCVSMRGTGYMLADTCREFGLPLGVAIHRVTERIGSFIAAMVDQGVMTEQAGRESAKEASEGAFARLQEIYPGEDGNTNPFGETPERLGVMLADYHASLGSDDSRFQHGLGMAMTAADEVWKGEGVRKDVVDARTMLAVDAAIRHWFRLTGRAVSMGGHA